MNNSWVPSGDDSAGWTWTYQTYDWKGRPRVITNPDGSTRENTYSGCGCAGGEQVTTRDERGRRKTLTMDVLGRLSKVEELNWNQTVYATTNYTYNARDQITVINQAGLTRTLNYDGYGRLSQRITPEQGTTSYTYNADDTVSTVTDARGATSTFTYNNRHLVTAITYGVPGGVAATPNVTYGYDAAGNRTSMTDGLGSVSYVYNTMSQMTSETRTFNDLGYSYQLGYTYNLGGQLSTITNQWASLVSYSYDKAGRVTSVTGSGQTSVPTYASNLQYRAFGGLKAMTYGNSLQLGTQYDTRMRLTRWNVAGKFGYDYSYSILADNSYRVSYADNLYDDSLNRSYDYDHLGRLEVAHSGPEAAAHVGLGSWGPQNQNLYSHHYGYDQYGNLNYRIGWGGTNPSYTAAFTNNKLPGMVYDASGNLTDAGGGWTFQYDATGQQTYSAAYNQQMKYDGDRLRGKKTVGTVST
jgi:YD repeat-containing protein